MFALLLLACSSEPPAPPVPVGPVGVDLELQCPTAYGTIALTDLSAPSLAPVHPTAGARGATVTVGVDGHYAVAVEEGDDGFALTIDVDRSGSIEPSERRPVDGGGKQSARFELPTSTRSGTKTTATVALRTSMHPDGEHRLLEIDKVCSARGTLPDGAPFGVRARSGVLDHGQTEVLIDLDGDGDVDFDNRLASVRLDEGVVPWAGRSWALSFEGTRMVLTPTDAPVTGLRAGALAPDFSAEATDGEVHDLARYRGKPVLLDFWATWCAPCIRAHPDVVKLADEHGIAVLGISADEDPEVVKRWLVENPTPWPSVVQGPAGETNAAYGVSNWPTYALLDADGRFLVLGDLSAVEPALEGL